MKKKKGIIIAVIAVIAIAAIGCGLYFGLGIGRSEAPQSEIEEGEIYRTKTESFWAGVGKAYISFQHKEEPEDKAADDTELYGDVFYIMVSSGDGYDPWLIGNWSLDEDEGELMMTAEWDAEAENQTMLADAEPGEEKIYLENSGEYKIPVKLPSADVTFTLNPKTDKVGDGQRADDEEEEADEEEAEEIQEIAEGDLFASLSAQSSLFNGSVVGYAQIDMAKDGTWTMKVKVDPYAPNFVQAVTGTWVENADGSVTLTPTAGQYKGSLPSSFTFVKSGDTYSGTVKFAADSANGIIFTFHFKSGTLSNTGRSSKSASAAQNSASQTKPVVQGEIYRTPVAGKIWSGVVGDAYMSFFGTGEFKLYVNGGNGDGYSDWLTGTWALSADKQTLTLTQASKGDVGLTGATPGVGKTYRASGGTFSIPVYFPSGGSLTISFNPSRDQVGSTASEPNTPTQPTQPTEPTQPDTPDAALQLELAAADTVQVTDSYSVTANAKLQLYDDNTFKMLVDAGEGYVDAASGTWALNDAFNMVLTVKEQTVSGSLADTITLPVDYETYKYSGTVPYTPYQGVTFTFNFVPVELQFELAATDTVNVGDYAVTAKAKLQFYNDDTFKMLVDAGEGDTEAASGTWTKNADGSLTLTMKEQTVADSLSDTVTLSLNSTTQEYSGTVPYQASAWTTFNFNFAAPTVLKTLTASDKVTVGGYDVTANAELRLYDNNTFKMLVNPGTGFTEAASGTWAMNTETYHITLNVTKQTVSNSLPGAIQLTCDYQTFDYSGTVQYVASQYTTFHFAFTSAAAGGTEVAETEVTETAQATQLESSLSPATESFDPEEAMDVLEAAVSEETSEPAEADAEAADATALAEGEGESETQSEAPAEPEVPSVSANITLKAGDAELTVKTDGTWTVKAAVDGNVIDQAASGSWEQTSDGSLVLTVKQAAEGISIKGKDLTDKISLTYNAGKYSGTIVLNDNIHLDLK